MQGRLCDDGLGGVGDTYVAHCEQCKQRNAGCCPFITKGKWCIPPVARLGSSI